MEDHEERRGKNAERNRLVSSHFIALYIHFSVMGILIYEVRMFGGGATHAFSSRGVGAINI